MSKKIETPMLDKLSPPYAKLIRKNGRDLLFIGQWAFSKSRIKVLIQELQKVQRMMK